MIKLQDLYNDKIVYINKTVESVSTIESFVSKKLDRKLDRQDRHSLACYVRLHRLPYVEASKIPFGGWSFSTLEERKFLPFLQMMIVMMAILSIVMSQHLTVLEPVNLVLPFGLLIFPLEYIILDSISELYGFAAARKTIYMTALLLLLAALLLKYSLELFAVNSGPFYTVFQHLPFSYAVNSVSFAFADLVTVFIFQILKSVCNSRALWLRSVVSNVVGQFIYSTVWFSLFFGPGNLTWNHITDAYFYKLAYLVLLLPLLYFIVYSVRAITRSRWINRNSVHRT